MITVLTTTTHADVTIVAVLRSQDGCPTLQELWDRFTLGNRQSLGGSMWEFAEYALKNGYLAEQFSEAWGLDGISNSFTKRLDVTTYPDGHTREPE